MIESKFLKELVDKPISGEWGDDGGNIKVLRTTNFTNERTIDYSDVVVRDIPFKRVEAKKLLSGDLIIEKSGGSPKQPVGRVVYFENSDLFLCNNFTSVLRPKRDLVFPKYLLYILFANHQYGFTGGFQNKTTGIINLQLARYIDKTKIPLPPLSQQKKIAAILDAADAYRQKTKILIEKYDELTQSLFLDMFGDPVTNPKGWEIKSLSEFIKSLNTGVSVNSTNKEYEEGDFGILKTSCVYSGIFRPSEAKVIREDEYERMRLSPKADSIIISRMNTTELVGKSAYIENDYNNLFLPDRLWQTEKAELLYDVRWLSHALSFQSFSNEIGKISSGTSGSMKNISKKNYLKLPMIYPPIKLQNQFANRVQAIEAQKEQVQASLAQAEELFNSLLQRAFKGELTS